MEDGFDCEAGRSKAKGGLSAVHGLNGRALMFVLQPYTSPKFRLKHVLQAEEAIPRSIPGVRASISEDVDNVLAITIVLQAKSAFGQLQKSANCSTDLPVYAEQCSSELYRLIQHHPHQVWAYHH